MLDRLGGNAHSHTALSEEGTGVTCGEKGRARAPEMPHSSKEIRKWAKVVTIGFFGLWK